VISTVAGNGNPGFDSSDDGGPATSAQFAGPSGIAVDTAGNLFIVDAGNCRIRKVTPGGVISTVAGNGNPGFSGDGGPATCAQINDLHGVAVDRAGNLFITDGARIRRIDGDRLLNLETRGNLPRIESRLKNQENLSATEGCSRRVDVD
jgi:DNA-binding beta-propeller fold protein YncE